MRIGIVGAGMAGLACAERLTARGAEVVLFDKGRGPGGRMSSRRLPTSMGEAAFDHGAQYFTVRDTAFRQRVDAWMLESTVAPWPAAGHGAYVGVPAMNAPIRQMAGRQKVRWATRVARLESFPRGMRFVLESGEALDFDLGVVATPAEQAADLLAATAPDLAERARAVPSEPCWTLMLAFSERVPVATDCRRNGDIIGWAARNGSKPGRSSLETWVVQASPAWSRAHLEADAGWVAATLERELAKLLNLVLPPCLARCSHRWRYAKCGAEGAGAIFDRDRRLGICGDWLLGPRVEAAWLSGTTLAERMGDGLHGAVEPGT